MPEHCFFMRVSYPAHSLDRGRDNPGERKETSSKHEATKATTDSGSSAGKSKTHAEGPAFPSFLAASWSANEYSQRLLWLVLSLASCSEMSVVFIGAFQRS